MQPPLNVKPRRSALVAVLGWALIVMGVVGLPISVISGAMVVTRSYGTQNADAAGIFTVVLGPAAVLACGIGLLRRWTWAWWGAVLLALGVCGFGLKDVLKKPAAPYTYTSESGTVTTVYSSDGSMLPVLVSGGFLAVLLLPTVRAQFGQRRPAAPPTAAAVVEFSQSDAPRTAIQEDILAALRAGAEFRTAHKEGGTTIRWLHGRFVREDYGEWSERAEYTDEAAFLAFLLRFFEWESNGRQNVSLPEPERWRNIRELLRGSGAPHIADPHSAPVRRHNPWRVVGAFLIAIPAVVLVFWLRGRLPHHSPAPQKLDTFDGRPPQVTQPEFKLPKTAATPRPEK